ncbi:MAG: hypothetical protein GX260_01895 [Tissierellia bacterium]|nr:hypothetical protein [Bacillota bacterium]NLL22522.1 hypothetical protein [Tissierellia bacterium]
MSKRVSLNVDGATVVMLTEASQERIDRVVKQVDDLINLVRRKDLSLSANMVYRYVMIYMSDQIVELQEMIDAVEGGSPTDKDSMNLRKEIQSLRQQLLQWEGRVGQLQELLLEKNTQIQELKAAK